MLERFYIPYDKISQGDAAQMTVTLTDERIREFSRLFGDDSSFHVDDESARMTVFGSRIAHGIHIAGYVSVLIGQQLPGFGTIYCSQTFDFKKPVYVGGTITVKAQVLEKLPHHRLRMSTEVFDHNEDTVLTGVAVIKTYA